MKALWFRLEPVEEFRLAKTVIISLVPRPSITTANTVKGLVKLLRKMTLGRRWEPLLIAWCISSTVVHRKCHASQGLPNVIVRRSFTRPSTTLAMIEGLGTRLCFSYNYLEMNVCTYTKLLASFPVQFQYEDVLSIHLKLFHSLVYQETAV